MVKPSIPERRRRLDTQREVSWIAGANTTTEPVADVVEDGLDAEEQRTTSTDQP